jgi:ATP-dependent helicase/nuclease subunit A
VLAHPIIRRAAVSAAAGRCRREAPVTLRLDRGAIVEGFVDLVFEDDGRFVVVDFKTDRELEGAIEQYRRQVQIYAHAVRVATGKSARAILMRV